MKKIILLTGIIFLQTISARAQLENFSIGIQSGLGISNLLVKEKWYENNEFSHINKNDCGNALSVLNGFQVNVKIRNRFTFQSEILMEDKSIGSQTKSWMSNVFIHFPEMIRYSIPVKRKSDKVLFIESGLYFSSLLFRHQHSPLSTDNSENRSGDIDFGIVSGIGYSWPVNLGRMDLTLKYENTFLPETWYFSGVDTAGVVHFWESRLFFRVLNFSFSYYLPVTKIRKLFHPDKRS